MKKALVIALVVWVISWLRAPDAVATSAARPWPAGMGRLEAVADRLPPQQANVASVKLMALANALPKNEAVGDFVAREIARGELTIGEPRRFLTSPRSASCCCASRRLEAPRRDWRRQRLER
jgi:hypothetical protein